MRSSVFGDVRLLVCAALLSILAGCFHDPDINKITCNQPKGCPIGYTCAASGKCCRSADGITCDAADAATFEVQSRIDSGAVDGVFPVDGSAADTTRDTVADVAGNDSADGLFDVSDSGGADVAAPLDVAADAPVGDSPVEGPTVDVAIRDVPAEGPAVDAPGTCSADKDCPATAPLCLANHCAKCAADTDCVGRAGPACATATGLCVACTANKYCTGAAATCDTTTSQCVGCVKRSDCPSACQACTNGVCTAVKNQDDPTVCTGTCDATGACKAKQGQTCQSVAGGCLTGTTCSPDGICCDKACTGSCEACDIATALGTCTTLAANVAPHSGHTACAGTGTCGGKCDGTTAACFYSTAACGTATCTGSSYQATGTCAVGSCNLPAAKTCPNGCSTTTPACACPPGFTGPNCDLSRFVVITPSTATTNSWANDTNADGTVVTGNQGTSAFIWTQAGGVKLLALSPSIASSIGYAINADGTVIVGQVVSSVSGLPQQAFRWTQATGMVALALSSTGKEAAMSVSGDGSTVVGYTDRFGSGSVPFRWTSSTGIVQTASVTGATATRALKISTDGSTVLGDDYNGNDNTGDVGIMWSGSAVGQILNLPIGYLDSQADAVTSNGSAIFGFYQAYAGPGIPFKWTASAGAVNLVQSTLNIWGVADVSGDGNILIGDGGSTGFVWDLTNGAPQLLADVLTAEGANLGGATLYPYAISGDGNVIVGMTTTSVAGTSAAFLARWR